MKINENYIIISIVIMTIVLLMNTCNSCNSNSSSKKVSKKMDSLIKVINEFKAIQSKQVSAKELNVWFYDLQIENILNLNRTPIDQNRIDVLRISKEKASKEK